MVFTGKCNFRDFPGGPFAAFPKQNDKCPTNARRGMCTLGIDWAILLCPAFVRSSRIKQIRRSNSDRAAGVEKTRLIKHSMVTDTQARRIITVSNIDQVIFFLIMLTHCFFPATIQLAKLQLSYDSRYNRPCEATFQQNTLFDPGLWHETRAFLCLVQSIGYI